jgi:hypothetical protein
VVPVDWMLHVAFTHACPCSLALKMLLRRLISSLDPDQVSIVDVLGELCDARACDGSHPVAWSHEPKLTPRQGRHQDHREPHLYRSQHHPLAYTRL